MLDLDCLGETSFDIPSPRIAKNYIMVFRMLFEKCSSCSGAISQPLNILLGRAFQSTIVFGIKLYLYTSERECSCWNIWGCFCLVGLVGLGRSFEGICLLNPVLYVLYFGWKNAFVRCNSNITRKYFKCFLDLWNLKRPQPPPIRRGIFEGVFIILYMLIFLKLLSVLVIPRQDLSFEPINKSLWPSVLKFEPVQEKC